MNEIYEKISAIINNNKQSTIDDRRHIHKYPELSFNEYETQKYICSRLDSMNVEYESGLIGTDVVALIKGEKGCSDKTLLLRADIDALPIEEISTKPYKSEIPGVMHACGHDGHTAILLGVCNVLSKLKPELCGNVKLVFQPGEETEGGAEPLINKGILNNPDVDACVALHMDSDIECGKIRVKKGPLYASPDDFYIIITGKGGHGAEPEKCINPITVASEIVLELEKFSKEINDAVVTVCTVNSGTATNIIPDRAVISGTARSLTHEIRNNLKSEIGRIAKTVSDKFNAECMYEYDELFPPLVNDPDLTNMLFESAKKCIGKENCIYGGEPTMAGEDFAYFAEKLPSVLFKLGCRNEIDGIVNPIHHSSFDIDEDCLAIGTEIITRFCFDFLNTQG